MDNRKRPIGFFDSGVGGLSVMKEALKLMPNEDYIYFGDSKNAPYGTKTVEEVRRLTFEAVDFLLKKGVKGIVIACNTATSAAVEALRNEYPNIPIVGIEPALKPAVELNKKGSILIMATSMTLKEKKFKNLMERYKDKADIIPVPCPGLVEFIEEGNFEGKEVEDYLHNKLNEFSNKEIASVVLGCTHYPFVKKTISKIIGDKIDIIDGGYGTAKEIQRRLRIMDLLNNEDKEANIEIINSTNKKEIIDLSYRLLNM
ncbi:glutamate racemase [Caproiciproducens sp. MSJ-32]|uniref:glutamate racemase n=1 Tax=Caproiciproducens sp. MSJ-32 TaxID=2841527 RepID=UPI001C1141E2|nr:glutamate racemase [Caproiciproducens sp. MSJ-32]MBU5453949.1 glutamate racemase [Caproiciproducens sp. MSJ-32]